VRQAIHIFKKDVRLLRFDIVFALLVAAALTFTASSGGESVRTSPSVGQLAQELLMYLLPLTWWSLIARAIYNEPLPGDRQFWVTRPYTPASLLLAKLLFVLAFVLLPKFVSDVIITNSYGFRIWPELGGLLWSQLLLTAVFVAPVIAICTLTTGFVQMISLMSTAALAVVVWTLVIPRITVDASWLGLDWIRSYATGMAVAAAAAGIIVLQYWRRDTKAARYVAGAGVAAAMLPAVLFSWPAAFAIQAGISGLPLDPATVKIALDREREWSTRAVSRGEGNVDLRIPIHVAGLAAEFKPRIDGITAAIESPSGRVWRADRYPPGQVVAEGMLTTLRIRVDEAFYQEIKERPVRIHGTSYVTLYGNERRTFIPLEDGTRLHTIPGAGLCSLTRKMRGCLLSCRSAFRSRLDLASIDIVGGGPQMMSFLRLSHSRDTPVSYTPFPADLSLIPVTLTTRHAEIQGAYEGAVIRAIEPVAHIRREFDLTDLRFTATTSARVE